MGELLTFLILLTRNGSRIALHGCCLGVSNSVCLKVSSPYICFSRGACLGARPLYCRVVLSWLVSEVGIGASFLTIPMHCPSSWLYPAYHSGLSCDITFTQVFADPHSLGVPGAPILPHQSLNSTEACLPRHFSAFSTRLQASCKKGLSIVYLEYQL